MSHIKTSLRFLSSPRIANSVSGSVDYLSLLAEPDHHVGVYLVLPSGKGKQCKSLIRWIFGIAAMHLARRGLGARPLVYIEEAATMGGASFIKTLVSEMRKYARVVLVYQSPGQVALHFGQHGAQEIFESCGTKIYLGGGIRTVETAKTVAESIGKTSIDVEDKMAEADRQYRAQRAQFDAMLNGQDLLLAEQIYSHELDQASNRKKVGRYALDPAELMRLNNEVVVLRAGAGAVLGQKMPGYWANPAMAGRFGPDPLFPPIDRVTFQRPFWGTTTRPFVRESAPTEFADWPNHSNGQVAYAKGYKTWGKQPLLRRWFGL